MKKTFFGRVVFTASTIRRAATVAVVLVLGTSVSAVILTRPFSNKQQEVTSTPIIPNHTQEEHFNDINLEDLEIDDEKEIRRIVPTNRQEETEEQYQGGGGGESTPSIPNATLSVVPGHITETEVVYDSANTYTLLSSPEGESLQGTVTYAITTTPSTPNTFKTFDEITTSSENTVSAIGTYYIWYHIQSNVSGYNSVTTKLHTFKIKGQPGDIVAPTIAGSTLDLAGGASVDLLSSPANSSTGTVKYLVSTQASNPTGTYETTYPPKATSRGTYYVWYYSEASDGIHDSTTPDKVGPITVIDSSLSPQKSDGQVTPPTLKNGPLEYTGGDIELLSNLGSTTTGTMMYYVSNSTTTPNISSFKQDTPAKTNIGTYYVWYYSKGDAAHYDTPIENSYVGPISIVEPAVTKSQPTINTIPAKIPGLSYSGQAQPLITAGQTNDGTFYYAKKNTQTNPSAGDYSTEIPQGTDAGTYYVWYYVKGDSNHYDSQAGCITVTISTNQANFVTQPTFATDLLYNSGPQNLVLDSGISSTGIIKFAVTDSDSAPTPDKYSSTIPQGIEAGTYHVWCVAGGNGNYGDSAPIHKEIAIKNKGKVIVTQAPSPISNSTFSQPGGKVAIHDNEGAVTTPDGEFFPKNFRFALSASSSIEPLADAYGSEIIGVDEPGTYYVWYYAVGGNDYLDSDKAWIKCELKKKQLIFEGTIVPYDNLVYNGEKQKLVDISGLSILDGSGTGDIVFYVSTTDISSQLASTYSSQGSLGSYSDLFKSTTEDPEVLMRTEPGTYYVYFYARGTGNYTDFIDLDLQNIPAQNVYKTVTIENSQITPAPVLTAPTVITNPNLIRYFETPNVSGSVQLLEAPATYSDGTNSYPVYYACTATNEQPNLNAFATYSNVVNQLQVSEPGLYYIWYYGQKPDGTKSDVNNVTIKFKGRPTLIQEPRVIPSSYGTDRFLLEQPSTPITPGLSIDGTLMYHLSLISDGTEPTIGQYSDQLPIVSQPGEYKLRYFIKGDDLHCDNFDEVESFTFYVAKKLIITKQPALLDAIVNGTYAPETNVGNTYVPVLKTLGEASDNAEVRYYIADEDEIIMSSDINNVKYVAAIANTVNDSSVSVNEAKSYYLFYYACVNNQTSMYYLDSEIGQIEFTVNPKEAYFIQDAIPVGVQGVDAIERVNDSTPLLSSPGNPVTGMVRYAITITDDEPFEDEYHYDSLYNLPFVYSAGHYYVWYKIDEYLPYYRGSTPQYLEVTIENNGVNDPVIQYTPPVAKQNIVYDGSEKTLLSFNGEISQSTPGSFTYCVVSSHSQDKRYSTSIPKATNAGTYYVYYNVIPSGRNIRSVDDQYIQVKIDKKDQANLSDLVLLEDINAPKAGESAVPVIVTEPTSTENTSAEYYFSKLDIEPNEQTQWVSASNVKVQEPGLYYIWYRCSESTNFKASPIRQTTFIVKGECPTNTNPVVDTGFEGEIITGITGKYNGQEQTPIRKGTSDYGTMKFAVNTVNEQPDKSLFNENIPTIKNVGTYYYFYYVESTSPLYHDSDVKSITVSIEKGIVTMKTPIQVDNAISVNTYPSGTEYSVVYNGSPITVSGECTDGGKIKAIVGPYEDVTGPNQAYYLTPTNYYDIDDPDLFANVINCHENGYIFTYYIELTDSDNYTLDSQYSSDQASLMGHISYVFILKGGPATIVDDPEPITFTQAPDTATALCTAGTASAGSTIYYAVSDTLVDIPTSSNAYSESIPTRKEPGTYYVYYYAGSDNENPSEVKYITVTIPGDVNYSVTFKSNLTVQLKQDGSGILDDVYIVESQTPGVDWYYRVSDGPKTTGATYSNPKVFFPGTYCVTYYYTDSSYTSDYRTTYINVGIGDTLLYTPTPAVGTVKYGMPLVNTNGIDVDDPNYYILYTVTNEEVEPSSDSFTFDNYYPVKAGVQYLWYCICSYSGGIDPLPPQHFAINVLKGTPEFENGTGPVLAIDSNTNYTGYDINVFDSDSLKIKDENQDLQLMFYISKDGANPNPSKELFTPTVPTVRNPGQYTISYYIKGNSNYDDSTVKTVSITVTNPQNPVITNPMSYISQYNGEPQLLVSQGEINSPFRFKYGIGTVNSAPSLDSFTDSIPTAINTGKYYVWWYVVAPDGYQLTTPVKADSYGSLPSTIQKADIIPNNPTFIASNEKEADGESICLVRSVPDDLDGRAIYYYLLDFSSISDYDKRDIPKFLNNYIPSRELFSADLPYVNSPGDYIVYWYYPESANYNEYGYNEKLRSSKITVTASSEIINPVKKDLIYTGEALQLVTAGITPNGQFVYVLGSNGNQSFNNSDYSPEIPTAIDCGTSYYVYYKIKYSNNTYSSANYVISTISKRKTEISTHPTFIYDNEKGTTRLLPGEHAVIEWDGNDHVFVDSTNPGVSGEGENSMIIFYMTNKFPTTINDFDAAFVIPSGAGSQIQRALPIIQSLNFNPDDKEILQNMFVPSLYPETDFNEALGESFKLPHASDPGVYTIYYTAVPQEYWASLITKEDINTDPLLHDEGNCSVHSFVIEIYQKQCKVLTKPTIKSSLVAYTGESIELINKGFAGDPSDASDPNIKMKYYVTRTPVDDISKLDKASFSENIPTAINVGTYYVYYYADGGTDYEDSAIGMVEGEIVISSDNAPVITAPLIVNNPCPLNISAASDSMEFVQNSLIVQMPTAVYTPQGGNPIDGSIKAYITTADIESVEYTDFSGVLKIDEDIEFLLPNNYKAWYYFDFGNGVKTSPEYVGFEIVKGVDTITPPTPIDESECFVSNLPVEKCFFNRGDSVLGKMQYNLQIYYDGETPSGNPPSLQSGWTVWSEGSLSYSGTTAATLRLWYYSRIDKIDVPGTGLSTTDLFANSEPDYIDVHVRVELPYDPAGTNVTPPTFAQGSVPSTTGGVPLASGGSPDRGWHFVYGVSQSEGVAPTTLTSTTVPKITSEGDYWVYAAEVCESEELGYYPSDFWHSEKITIIQGKASLKAKPDKPANLGYKNGNLVSLVDLGELYGSNRSNYLYDSTDVRFFVTGNPSYIPNPNVDTFASASVGDPSSVARTEKGTYYVWLVVDDNTGVNKTSDPILLYSATITNPVAAVDVLPQAGKIRVDNLTDLALLTSDGNSADGTLMYYVSKDKELPDDIDKELFKPFKGDIPYYPTFNAYGLCYIHVYVKANDPTAYLDSEIDPQFTRNGARTEFPILVPIEATEGSEAMYLYYDVNDINMNFEYTGEEQDVLNNPVSFIHGRNKYDSGNVYDIYYGVSYSINEAPELYLYNYRDVKIKNVTTTSNPAYLHIKVVKIEDQSVVLDTTVQQEYAIPLHVKGTPVTFDTVPTAKNANELYFVDSPIDLINYGSSSNALIKYYVTTDLTYTPSDADFVSDTAKADAIGTYYVWYKAFATDPAYASSKAEFIMVNITPNYDIGVMPQALNVPIILPEGEVQLISEGIKTGYQFEYYHVNGWFTYPLEQSFIDNSIIPEMNSKNPTVSSTQYGSYTYFWRIKAIDDSEWGELNHIEVNYYPSDSGFNKPLFSEKIIYNGEYQSLCNNPNLGSGKIKYCVGFNQLPQLSRPPISSNYSDDVPQGRECGDYYIEYIWVSDDDTVLAGPFLQKMVIDVARVELIMNDIVSGSEYDVYFGGQGEITLADVLTTLPSYGEGGNGIYYMISDSEPVRNYNEYSLPIDWIGAAGEVKFNAIGTYKVWFFACKDKNSGYESSDLAYIVVNVKEAQSPTIVTPPTFKVQPSGALPIIEVDYEDIAGLDLLETQGEVENGKFVYNINPLTRQYQQAIPSILESGDSDTINALIQAVTVKEVRESFVSKEDNPDITKFASAQIEAVATNYPDSYYYFTLLYAVVGDVGYTNLPSTGYILKVYFPPLN